jgi:3-hydroxy-3-methylglutaryl CoA synthase
LVIATDMARRLFGNSGEAAEGAGSVAMVVSAEPRVLALDSHRGFASREIYDVMRPNPVLETIHAELSLSAYLDLLEMAWQGYLAAAGPQAFERLDYLVFHTPIVPLVEQAHRVLLDLNGIDDKKAVTAHFDRRVRPSLRYCRQLGNLYSGCLYAALAGLVDTAPKLSAGEHVGLYSYGSGSGASYFSGVLGADARATVERHGIAAQLSKRRFVDLPTYERIVVDNERALTEASFTPDHDLCAGLYETRYLGRGRLVLKSVRDYYRSYAWS